MRNIITPVFILVIMLISCSKTANTTNHPTNKPIRIAFLHRSVGAILYKGNTPTILHKVFKKAQVASWFATYNKENSSDYELKGIYYPTKDSYGDNNYPYDYYNIWVNHAGKNPYKGQATLEILTQNYEVIMFKHCFPVGEILPDLGTPDVNSEEKRIENYKAQYILLKAKMRSFPNTKFILWTVPAMTREVTTEEKAGKMKEFVDWVKNTWDEPGDNIYLWDFYALETEGGLFVKDSYATSPKNPHPNQQFATNVVPYFCKRILDVAEGRGDTTPITGK